MTETKIHTVDEIQSGERLAKIEETLKKLSEQNDLLAKENAELRKANQDLYTFAAKRETKEKEGPAPGKEVEDPKKTEAETAKAKTLDEIYKATIKKLGYEADDM